MVAMEVRRDSEFDELIGEVPLLVRQVVKDFLKEQNLNTLDDMASLHQDDLTEAFKVVPADFTLGHRSVVRRLCAAARMRVTTGAQVPSNATACVRHESFRSEDEPRVSPNASFNSRSASPAIRQRVRRSEDERQGSPGPSENAKFTSPVTRHCLQRSEGSPFAWQKARSSSPASTPVSTPASTQRFQRSETVKSSYGNREISPVIRTLTRSTPTRSTPTRDTSPAMHCRTPNRPLSGSVESAKLSSQHKSVFNRAGARANPCGRETTWSQLASKVANGPPFHLVSNATLAIRPSSPKASMGKTRRPEVFSIC